MIYPMHSQLTLTTETYNMVMKLMTGMVDKDSGITEFVVSSSRFLSARDLLKWVSRTHKVSNT